MSNFFRFGRSSHCIFSNHVDWVFEEDLPVELRGDTEEAFPHPECTFKASVQYRIPEKALRECRRINIIQQAGKGLNLRGNPTCDYLVVLFFSCGELSFSDTGHIFYKLTTCEIHTESFEGVRQ